ncbi:Adhesin [Candidatus Electronema halotolerans]
MRTFFLMLCCMFSAMTVQAAQNCRPDSIPASTPDSQLVDNGDGTVTDSKTSLTWKKCVEGFSGDDCGSGTPDTFTWQEALQQSSVVNNSGGFAGHTDWRLPNINELISLVEEQCSNPAINLNRFPNTPSSVVWSGSPYAGYSVYAWYVDFHSGGSNAHSRNYVHAVRLVRGGQ